MTSEVVLMNRSAVALAADSAVTVTYWHRGKQERRFFKGANKIFNLSNVHPVGLMTYATATIQGVPLEVVVKAYRTKLKTKAYPALEGYAKGFFEYVQSNKHLFPEVYQQDQFKTEVKNLAFYILFNISFSEEYKNEEDVEKKKKIMQEAWEAERKRIIDAPLLGNATKNDVTAALKDYEADLATSIGKEDFYSAYRDLGLVAADLVKLAIIGTFKTDVSLLDKTGIVIAGYGDNEFFPSCIVYECWGVVLGKFIYQETKRKAATHESVSHVVPVAQSEMVNTFIHGISPSAVGAIGSIFRKALHAFEKEACKDDQNRQELRVQASERFRGALLEMLFQEHTIPLRRVVGSLSISELAELAETLITIESLKERVTEPTESVSGPVDVAVISKGDGFIWVRRKHYFDPKLNPRFFARRDTKGGDE